MADMVLHHESSEAHPHPEKYHNYEYAPDKVYHFEYPTWRAALNLALQFARHPQAWHKPFVAKAMGRWWVHVEVKP